VEAVVTPTPPRFILPEGPIAGPLKFEIAAIPGNSIQIESSADLKTWQLEATLTPSSVRTPFQDPAPIANTLKFFRVKLGS
jgi:hypothetical protein